MQLVHRSLPFLAVLTASSPAYAGGSGPFIIAGAVIIAGAILVLAAVIRACCNKRPPM